MSIDFDHFTVLNLPRLLRQLKNKAFLKAAMAPFVSLYNETMAYIDESIELANYTSQIGSLEHLLNKKFNNDQSGIYIEDNAVKPITYLFDPEEQMTPAYLFSETERSPLSKLYIPNAPITYIFSTEELTSNDDGDFIVYVPSALSFDENEMKAIVNRYKLAGLRYTIKTY